MRMREARGALRARGRMGWQRLVMALLLCLVGACSSSPEAGPTPRVSIEPESSRFDTPVGVAVEGLLPEESVTVRTTSRDARGVEFVSEVEFVADEDGNLELATAEAVGGSYQGVDPMGFITSMTARDHSAYLWLKDDNSFTIEVSQGKGRVEAEFQRRAPFASAFHRGGSYASEVGLLSLDPDGFVGSYFRPPTPNGTPAAAVLMFGGSEGGKCCRLEATTLAGLGIPVLTIAYHGQPGLPESVSAIPLEYFELALEWLVDQPEVDPTKVFLYGASRGSEAALLTALRRPDLVTGGVIVTAPSNVAVCDIPGCRGPAWTADGEAVPYTRRLNTPAPTDEPAAVIPVEKLTVPLLAACGGVDRIWPSCRYSDAMRARLDEAQHPAPYDIIEYPEAGHGITFLLPYQPGLPDQNRGRGRTDHANQHARADLWPRVLELLGI